jgi:TonB-linked SusC/RagA family outer membrane protein
VVSVEVLKDASATAIYGSRGANGVILITTRKGKSGKPQINYSAFGGVTKARAMYKVMDGKKYETYNKWATYNTYNPSSPDVPNPYNGIDDPKFYSDGLTFLPQELNSIENGLSTDWQKLIFQNGFKTDHQLSISGGTNNTQYAISGGYYNETGIFPGIQFRRYYLKLSLDQQIGKYVKLSFSSLNSVSVIDGESINPLPQALMSSPLAQPYDENGNLIPFPNGGSLIYNPLANLIPGAMSQRRKRFNTFSTGFVEVNITPKLKYRFNGGVQYTPETYGDFFSSQTYQSLSGPSRGDNRNYDYYDYTLENLLIYDNTFAKNHHINFTGLFSYQEDYKASTSFSYNNILADYIEYFNPALGANLNGSGAYAKFNIVSFMGRLNYNYKSKYLLTVTARSDGSSTLAKGNKYHLFPSVAAGWNIGDENFLKNADFISNLKLRLSYGEVGNAAVAPYQTLGGLAAINYNYGSTNVTGTYPVNIPNPNLGWEYT